MEITFAMESDLKDILELQYLAYRSEAEIYNDYTIQPLIQTLQELKDEFDLQTILKVDNDQVIIGSVRAYKDNLTCNIGKLIVHPDHQNKGIGTRLMKDIESRFNDCNRFELFTGDKSVRNIHLYSKLGYKIFKTTEVNSNLKIIHMEKITAGLDEE